MLKFGNSKNDGVRAAVILFSSASVIAMMIMGGCRQYESIGGGWYASKTTRFPEAGIQSVTIYRGESGGLDPVASQVLGWFYFGADCLAYITAEASRVYVACGDRKPVVLDTSSVRGEVISPQLGMSGVEYRTLSGENDNAKLLRFARDRILSAAMAQPVRDGTVDTGVTLIRPDSLAPTGAKRPR